MAARIIEIANAVKSRIEFGWDVPAPATVTRKYLLDVEDERGLQSLSGRQVYVFPAAMVDAGEIARSRIAETEYRIAVLIVEPYTTAGQPSNSWLDERLAWVESDIWNKLAPSDSLRSYESDVWTETAEMLVAYDAAILREQRAFWCEFEFGFREDA